MKKRTLSSLAVLFLIASVLTSATASATTYATNARVTLKLNQFDFSAQQTYDWTTPFTNWTATINLDDLKTTNATGVHTYTFYYLDDLGNGTIIEIQDVNQTVNSVYLNSFYLGGFGTQYQGYLVNASAIVFDYNGIVKHLYIDGVLKFQWLSTASNLKTVIMQTQDINAGYGYANFDGTIRFTFGYYTGNANAINFSSITDLFITLAVIGIIIGSLSSLTRRQK